VSSWEGSGDLGKFRDSKPETRNFLFFVFRQHLVHKIDLDLRVFLLELIRIFVTVAQGVKGNLALFFRSLYGFFPVRVPIGPWIGSMPIRTGAVSIRPVP
jgi:hypothetical protein